MLVPLTYWHPALTQALAVFSMGHLRPVTARLCVVIWSHKPPGVMSTMLQELGGSADSQGPGARITEKEMS